MQIEVPLVDRRHRRGSVLHDVGHGVGGAGPPVDWGRQGAPELEPEPEPELEPEPEREPNRMK